MNMTVSSKLNQKAFFLGIFGFVLSAFVSVLNYGIGVGREPVYRENKFFPVGFNPFRDLALRCVFISILFLCSSVLIKLSENLLVRILALIISVLTAYQCVILIGSDLAELPNWVTEYSRGLVLILYAGHFFLGIAVVLLLLQVSLIWLINRSSNHESP
jgi:hypothetical protein